MTNEGKLIIFSAPSGAGKTTIVQHLLTKIPKLEFSISATTRKPRGDEQNGKDYYFISKEEFLHRIARKQFVEFEEVYTGTFYGTLRTEIERIWQKDKAVIFDIDVEGGLHLKRKYNGQALAIFVQPP
jgi:guanylate kinase